MTEAQKKEMERELWKNKIRRMLGVPTKKLNFGDPLPDVLRDVYVQKRAGTRYEGSEEDIQVRIG